VPKLKELQAAISREAGKDPRFKFFSELAQDTSGPAVPLL
jgi:hypothetical protein